MTPVERLYHAYVGRRPLLKQMVERVQTSVVAGRAVVSVAELRRVRAMRQEIARLVVRVLLEAAREVLARTPEVENLAALGDDDAILTWIARAIGIREERGLVVDCVSDQQRTVLGLLLDQGMGEFGLLVDCASATQRANVVAALGAIPSQNVPPVLADPIAHREAPPGPATWAAANPRGELTVAQWCVAYAEAAAVQSGRVVAGMADLFDVRKRLLAWVALREQQTAEAG